MQTIGILPPNITHVAALPREVENFKFGTKLEANATQMYWKQKHISGKTVHLVFL